MSTAAYVAMASAPISPEIQPAEDHRPETSIDDSLMGGLDGTEMYTTNVDEAGWQDEPVTSPIRSITYSPKLYLTGSAICLTEERMRRVANGEIKSPTKGWPDRNTDWDSVSSERIGPPLVPPPLPHARDSFASCSLSVCVPPIFVPSSSGSRRFFVDRFLKSTPMPPNGTAAKSSTAT